MAIIPLEPLPWAALRGQPATVLDGGLINSTWAVGDPPVAVVQRLHEIFKPALHGDIEAVTAHLAAAGMDTPRLLPTDDGALFALDDEGGCWRALGWVTGRSYDKLTEPALAAAAGDLVGRWHRATADLQHEFAYTRPGAHDTEAHLATLRRAVREHAGHRLYDRVVPLADSIEQAWASWRGRLDLPPRIVHGDLKISNLRLDDAGRGLCLLDLDTLAMLPLDVELGDAWRSGCNPAGEDVGEASFALELFEASAAAYLQANPLDVEVRAALPGGVERICLELAARFAADALNERYFGWSPRVAPGRGEHNLLRALGQRSLAASVRAQRGGLERALRI